MPVQLELFNLESQNHDVTFADVWAKLRQTIYKPEYYFVLTKTINDTHFETFNKIMRENNGMLQTEIPLERVNDSKLVIFKLHC